MVVGLLWKLIGGFRGVLTAGVGGLLAAGLVWGWMSLVTVPATEREANRAGYDRCQAEVDKAHQAEIDRQREENREALDAARIREQELAAQADDLNDQLQDLAHAIMSDADSARVCLGAERVRDLNRIR